MKTISIILGILIVLAGSSVVAFAEEDLPVSYCHDDEVAADWERMLAKNPEDPIIIKLYSLRIGICQLIDEDKLSLEQGILIWEQERARGVIQRAREDVEKNKEFTL